VRPNPTCLWTMPSVATPRPDVDRRHDVGVVGAGLGGLAAALHAAEAGAWVVLLDAGRMSGGRMSGGAASRGGGQVLPGFTLAPGAIDAGLIHREANR
jgi:glycine/D-amino acid oxidase-like deaminating enzyme